MQHRLSEKNIEKRTGTCAVCGPVKLKRHNARRYRCLNASNRYSKYHDGTYYKDRPKPEGQSCEICGSQKLIRYDHDHATNKFRGWLCQNCNLMLGNAKDDINILQTAIKYLSRDLL